MANRVVFSLPNDLLHLQWYRFDKSIMKRSVAPFTWKRTGQTEGIAEGFFLV